MATILSIATTVPAYRHSQMELHDRWLAPFIKTRHASLIFEAAEIESRYSVLAEASFLDNEPSTKTRNDRYLVEGRRLAIEVIKEALAKSNLSPTDIDHFIVISCTGFDCPGLDVSLAADMGMRADMRRSALIGMGCYAGLTGLDRAMLELAARPHSHVLVLAVELCTLQFQHGRKMENMVAGALFGDGLAAVVVGPDSKAGTAKIQVLDTMTYTDYTAQNLMGVHLSDIGFQISLATSVPKLLRDLVPGVVDKFLHQVGLPKEQIRFWGLHPGGARIVEYVGQALNLRPEDLASSWRVLRQYGNMSAATIFFVLADLIATGQPQPGDNGILLSFGPGLTIEQSLLQW